MASIVFPPGVELNSRARWWIMAGNVGSGLCDKVLIFTWVGTQLEGYWQGDINRFLIIYCDNDFYYYPQNYPKTIP